MMIENISSMSTFQPVDVKAEKKTEAEDVRTIEGSEESHDAKLDINRENVTKNQTEHPQIKEPNILAYDAKGNALDDPHSDPQPHADGEIMDLIA